MDFLELETLKQTREYKAAEALTDAVNSMGWKPEKFAMGMTVQHRTLQQEVMRTFVAMIHVMASDNYGFDDRNRGSHEAAKKMVESGILEPRRWLRAASSTKSTCLLYNVPRMYLCWYRHETLEPTDERQQATQLRVVTTED